MNRSPPKFKIGDSVQLTSGGMAMTIVEIEDESAKCIWLDKTGRDRERSVPVSALMHDQLGTDGTLIIEGYNATSQEIAEYKRNLGLGHA
jgi:uncharacterized protein YodC (DUF2158 family)